MKKISKRISLIREKISSIQKYNILDGLRLLKETKYTKFVESVDVSIKLGIDSRKSDQNIRNHVIMPNGIERNLEIAVFVQMNDVDLVKKEGIDLVGLENLYTKIKTEGCNNLDIVLATPSVMNIVGKLGSILGPKGLMPNPKMGTVSKNIIESIRNVKSGKQVRYKNDKNGIIHVTIGKTNFDLIHLQKNLESLITSIKQVKPIQCKGTYIKKVFVSTTMGGSVLIDKDSLGIPIY